MAKFSFEVMKNVASTWKGETRGIESLSVSIVDPKGETHELNNGTLLECLEYGIRQKIRDGSASVKADDPDAEEMATAAQIQRLERMQKGLMNTRTSADPVERKALEMAKAQINAAIKKAGLKADAKEVTARAKTFLESEKAQAIWEAAQEAVEAEKRLAIDADDILGDLLGDGETDDESETGDDE